MTQLVEISIGHILHYFINSLANVRTGLLLGLLQNLLQGLLTAILGVVAKLIALIIVKMIINLLRSLDITKNYTLDKEFNFYDVDTNVNQVQQYANNEGGGYRGYYPGAGGGPIINIGHADVYQPPSRVIPFYPPPRHTPASYPQLQPQPPQTQDDGLLQNFLLLDVL